jgi:hypothetical protein
MARQRDRDPYERGYVDRRVAVRDPRPRILILSSGERTELNYFNEFPLDRDRVTPRTESINASPGDLVREAEVFRRRTGHTRPRDQVWCVFDRDEFTAEEYNEAVQGAAGRGLRVAYSNEAFELWYLLHFDYVDAAISRADLCEKLSVRLGRLYRKNGATMYVDLRDRQARAIANAERLLAQYDGRNPAAENPSTTVHLLVQALNRFLV